MKRHFFTLLAASIIGPSALAQSAEEMRPPRGGHFVDYPPHLPIQTVVRACSGVAQR
jgi:hypothetical protein